MMDLHLLTGNAIVNNRKRNQIEGALKMARLLSSLTSPLPWHTVRLWNKIPTV